MQFCQLGVALRAALSAVHGTLLQSLTQMSNVECQMSNEKQSRDTLLSIPVLRRSTLDIRQLSHNINNFSRNDDYFVRCFAFELLGRAFIIHDDFFNLFFRQI